jgi:hypothetical protein
VGRNTRSGEVGAYVEKTWEAVLCGTWGFQSLSDTSRPAAMPPPPRSVESAGSLEALQQALRFEKMRRCPSIHRRQ